MNIVFSVCITKVNYAEMSKSGLDNLQFTAFRSNVVVRNSTITWKLLTTRGNINSDLNKMKLETKNFIVGMIIDDC